MNTAHKKPRLALMGEFSAGKSTLTNLLLGAAPLPTRVTATRLPPVWLSYGTGPARRFDLDGTAHDLPGGVLDCVSPDNTRLVHMQVESEMLELCDLIDLPGISDPNMPSDMWQNVMQDVDQVVWCTHATQAWRQSEAAAWESVVDMTNGRNLMLVTQVDKLTSDRDRDRVLSRVKSETADLFAGHYPISLTEALAAGDDAEKWHDSGAADFTGHLVELLIEPADAPVQAEPRPTPRPQRPAAVEPITIPAGADAVLPKRVRNRPGDRLRTRPVIPGSDMPVIRDLNVGGGESA